MFRKFIILFREAGKTPQGKVQTAQAGVAEKADAICQTQAETYRLKRKPLDV